MKHTHGPSSSYRPALCHVSDPVGYIRASPNSKQELEACCLCDLVSYNVASLGPKQQLLICCLCLWPMWLTQLPTLMQNHSGGSQYHLQAAAAGLPSLSLTQLVISWPVPASCNSYWSANFLSDPVGYIIGSPCSKQQLLVCPLCLWPSWLHGSQYQLQAAYTGLLSLPLTQSDTWYVANTSSKIEAVLACPPVISSMSVSIQGYSRTSHGYEPEWPSGKALGR